METEAYDTWNCYKAAYERWQEADRSSERRSRVNENEEPWMTDRNDAICQMIGLGNDELAIALWKKLIGYHERSLVKTSFSRFKGIFGPKLFSRSADNQYVELMLKA